MQLQKPDFIGREGLLAWQEKGFANSFVTLEIKDTADRDVIGGNPIYRNGELVGRATSGGYGFRLGKSLALAMVSPDCADLGTALEIDILGDRFAAEIIEESPFDPANERLRG